MLSPSGMDRDEPRPALRTTTARAGVTGFCLALLSLLVLVLTLAPTLALAAPPAAPLQVAVKHAPPFSERGPDGEWTGVSVELWREIAAELELDYELRETSLDEMLDGLAEGRYDVAVAALTVTAAREERVDFTHPFYTTGLAIAVPKQREPAWRRVVETVVSPVFLQLIVALALIQLGVGSLVWALERRANPDQFPDQPTRGIASGFWWATVTMTTVGYGDKAPKSALGRAVALVWMLASMIILASVTATIASSLPFSVAQVFDPSSLPRSSVTVLPSASCASIE